MLNRQSNEELAQKLYFSAFVVFFNLDLNCNWLLLFGWLDDRPLLVLVRREDVDFFFGRLLLTATFILFGRFEDISDDLNVL